MTKKTLKIDYVEAIQTKKGEDCHAFSQTEILTSNRNEDHVNTEERARLGHETT